MKESDVYASINFSIPHNSTFIVALAKNENISQYSLFVYSILIIVSMPEYNTL